MVALVLDGLVGFPAGLSPTSFQQFYSFVSQVCHWWCQAGCLWSGSRPACLPLPSCSRFPAACLPLAFVSNFFPKQFTVRGSQFFLKMCPPFVSLLSSCLPSCLSLCPPSLPSVSLCLRSCLASCWPSCLLCCWSLCPPCLNSVILLFPSSFCLPSCFPFLLMSQKVDLGMLRCCPTCLGPTVV